MDHGPPAHVGGKAAVVQCSSFSCRALRKLTNVPLKKGSFLKRKGSSKPVSVGGFNPSEKYESNWIISPNRDENKKIFETPAQYFSGANCLFSGESLVVEGWQDATARVEKAVVGFFRVGIITIFRH